MGTDKTRAAKIEWMMDMKNKIKDDDLLMRNFIVRFSSTKHTAKEILDIVKWQKTLKNKTLD